MPGAAKPLGHNYWACALGPCSTTREARTTSPHSKKPAQQEARTAQLDSSLRSDEDQAEPEISKNKHKFKKIKLEGARQQKAMVGEWGAEFSCMADFYWRHM